MVFYTEPMDTYPYKNHKRDENQPEYDPHGGGCIIVIFAILLIAAIIFKLN